MVFSKTVVKDVHKITVTFGVILSFFTKCVICEGNGSRANQQINVSSKLPPVSKREVRHLQSKTNITGKMHQYVGTFLQKYPPQSAFFITQKRIDSFTFVFTWILHSLLHWMPDLVGANPAHGKVLGLGEFYGPPNLNHSVFLWFVVKTRIYPKEIIAHVLTWNQIHAVKSSISS